VFVAIVRGERTGVLISCFLAVLSVVAEEGVWGGGRGGERDLIFFKAFGESGEMAVVAEPAERILLLLAHQAG
jgi:hypothetical protein